MKGSCRGQGREEGDWGYELADLFIEREVLDVDLARTFQNDHRQPRDVPIVRNDHVCADLIGVARHVSTVNT